MACHSDNDAGAGRGAYTLALSDATTEPAIVGRPTLFALRRTASGSDIDAQTDTSVGDWFYNVRDVYKTPEHVVELLVDIVSVGISLDARHAQAEAGQGEADADQGRLLISHLGS